MAHTPWYLSTILADVTKSKGEDGRQIMPGAQVEEMEGFLTSARHEVLGVMY